MKRNSDKVIWNFKFFLRPLPTWWKCQNQCLSANCFWRFTLLNWCFPIASFLYPLKTSENLTVFSWFQDVEIGCIGNKWVNMLLFFVASHYTRRFFCEFTLAEAKLTKIPLPIIISSLHSFHFAEIFLTIKSYIWKALNLYSNCTDGEYKWLSSFNTVHKPNFVNVFI